MQILPDPIAFMWDQGNLEKNRIKHKVTIMEAEETFSNQPLVTREDTKHPAGEKRYQALGKTKTNRRLFVAFTVRDKKIRVISIRDMTKNEEAAYEKHEANS